MIYFNNQANTETAPARLRLTQRNLALALEENNRLRAENEELYAAAQRDARDAVDSAKLLAAQFRRIEELRAENENLVAENVRLTGQIHALLATIEAQL